MYISSVSIENFRAFKEKTVFHFNPGVTVLIGENDCGKSTVIDAIRYVLGTTDQSWQRILSWLCKSRCTRSVGTIFP